MFHYLLFIYYYKQRIKDFYLYIQHFYYLFELMNSENIPTQYPDIILKQVFIYLRTH